MIWQGQVFLSKVRPRWPPTVKIIQGFEHVDIIVNCISLA